MKKSSNNCLHSGQFLLILLRHGEKRPSLIHQNQPETETETNKQNTPPTNNTPSRNNNNSPNMKSTLRILLIGSAAIASAGLASASLLALDPVLFNSFDNDPLLPAIVPVHYPTLTFASFDTLGGTRILNSVELNWTVNSRFENIILTNNNNKTVTLNEADFTADFSAKQGVNPLTYLSAAPTTNYASPGLSVTNHGTVTIADFSSFNTSTGFVPVSGSLSAYTSVGPGTVSLDLEDTFSLAVKAKASGSSSNWGLQYDAFSVGNVVVHYNFTAVPEPGSLLALGCLVGSGAFLRTRRRHA